MTKVEKFKIEVEELILSGKLKDNAEVLIHTYLSGHIPSHSSEVVRRLKKDQKISFDGKTPGINYDNVFKKQNIVKYKII